MVNKVIKYALLAFPLASSGLGYWQIKRLEWKKGLLADLERQMQSGSVNLTDLDLSKGVGDYEYRRVAFRGRYDTDVSHQLYLTPRQLVVNDEAITRGRSEKQSGIGVNVITPFHLDGTERRVLVNRGWLSSKGRDCAKDNAQVGLTAATQELTGVLRKSDKRSTYGINNDATRQEWHIRDIELMAKRLDTEPVLIDLDADPNRTEGPYGGQTQLNIRNEHLNYAITWFSLAALSFAMWYTKFGRQKRVMR